MEAITQKTFGSGETVVPGRSLSGPDGAKQADANRSEHNVIDLTGETKSTQPTRPGGVAHMDQYEPIGANYMPDVVDIYWEGETDERSAKPQKLPQNHGDFWDCVDLDALPCDNAFQQIPSKPRNHDAKSTDSPVSKRKKKRMQRKLKKQKNEANINRIQSAAAASTKATPPVQKTDHSTNNIMDKSLGASDSRCEKKDSGGDHSTQKKKKKKRKKQKKQKKQRVDKRGAGNTQRERSSNGFQAKESGFRREFQRPCHLPPIRRDLGRNDYRGNNQAHHFFRHDNGQPLGTPPTRMQHETDEMRRRESFYIDRRLPREQQRRLPPNLGSNADGVRSEGRGDVRRRGGLLSTKNHQSHANFRGDYQRERASTERGGKRSRLEPQDNSVQKRRKKQSSSNVTQEKLFPNKTWSRAKENAKENPQHEQKLTARTSHPRHAKRGPLESGDQAKTSKNITETTAEKGLRIAPGAAIFGDKKDVVFKAPPKAVQKGKPINADDCSEKPAITTPMGTGQTDAGDGPLAPVMVEKKQKSQSGSMQKNVARGVDQPCLDVANGKQTRWKSATKKQTVSAIGEGASQNPFVVRKKETRKERINVSADHTAQTEALHVASAEVIVMGSERTPCSVAVSSTEGPKQTSLPTITKLPTIAKHNGCEVGKSEDRENKGKSASFSRLPEVQTPDPGRSREQETSRENEIQRNPACVRVGVSPPFTTGKASSGAATVSFLRQSVHNYSSEQGKHAMLAETRSGCLKDDDSKRASESMSNVQSSGAASLSTDIEGKKVDGISEKPSRECRKAALACTVDLEDNVSRLHKNGNAHGRSALGRKGPPVSSRKPVGPPFHVNDCTPDSTKTSESVDSVEQTTRPMVRAEDKSSAESCMKASAAYVSRTLGKQQQTTRAKEREVLLTDKRRAVGRRKEGRKDHPDRIAGKKRKKQSPKNRRQKKLFPNKTWSRAEEKTKKKLEAEQKTSPTKRSSRQGNRGSYSSGGQAESSKSTAQPNTEKGLRIAPGAAIFGEKRDVAFKAPPKATAKEDAVGLTGKRGIDEEGKPVSTDRCSEKQVLAKPIDARGMDAGEGPFAAVIEEKQQNDVNTVQKDDKRSVDRPVLDKPNAKQTPEKNVNEKQGDGANAEDTTQHPLAARNTKAAEEPFSISAKLPAQAEGLHVASAGVVDIGSERARCSVAVSSTEGSREKILPLAADQNGIDINKSEDQGNNGESASFSRLGEIQTSDPGSSRVKAAPRENQMQKNSSSRYTTRDASSDGELVKSSKLSSDTYCNERPSRAILTDISGAGLRKDTEMASERASPSSGAPSSPNTDLECKEMDKVAKKPSGECKDTAKFSDVDLASVAELQTNGVGHGSSSPLAPSREPMGIRVHVDDCIAKSRKTSKGLDSAEQMTLSHNIGVANGEGSKEHTCDRSAGDVECDLIAQPQQRTTEMKRQTTEMKGSEMPMKQNYNMDRITTSSAHAKDSSACDDGPERSKSLREIGTGRQQVSDNKKASATDQANGKETSCNIDSHIVSDCRLESEGERARLEQREVPGTQPSALKRARVGPNDPIVIDSSDDEISPVLKKAKPTLKKPKVTSTQHRSSKTKKTIIDLSEDVDDVASRCTESKPKAPKRAAVIDLSENDNCDKRSLHSSSESIPPTKRPLRSFCSGAPRAQQVYGASAAKPCPQPGAAKRKAAKANVPPNLRTARPENAAKPNSQNTNFVFSKPKFRNDTEYSYNYSQSAAKFPNDTAYNYNYSQSAAQQEQERLIREARARAVQRGAAASTGRQPVFTRPVEDISKLRWDHYKWPNLYARLGLPPGCPVHVIKAQYRRLALAYHPDKSKLPDTATRFQAVTEAYKSLTRT